MRPPDVEKRLSRTDLQGQAVLLRRAGLIKIKGG
jgi:hypothetical protein